MRADLELTLEAPHRYQLRETLSGQRMGPGDPCLAFAEGSVEWALGTPSGAASLRVALRPGGALRVEAWGDDLDWLSPRLPALLGLGDDVSGFDPEHPVLRRVWRRHAGLRLPRLPRLFQRLVAVVLLQRVTTREAQAAWSRLVSAHGRPAPGPAGLRVPPGPERLGGLPEWELVRLGVPHRQADTLRRLARSAPRLEAAAERGPGALAGALSRIPGIGPWSTQYVLGSALGVADAVLVGDDNLPHSVAWLLAGEERADDARMLELLEPFRGHRFRVIRLVWVSGLRAPRRGPGRRLSGLSVDRPRRAR